VKEDTKELQPSTSSQEEAVVVIELNEIKWNICCECDKDATYNFACKHGVIWFAANVIMLKIRR